MKVNYIIYKRFVSSVKRLQWSDKLQIFRRRVTSQRVAESSRYPFSAPWSSNLWDASEV